VLLSRGLVQYGQLLLILSCSVCIDVAKRGIAMADEFDIEAMLEETYRRQVCM